MQGRRYMVIWFRHLLTDAAVRRFNSLQGRAFVIVRKERGRKVIVASSLEAEKKGIYTGMVLADATAALPDLEVLDETPGQRSRLLQTIAEWSIRYSPAVAIGEADTIIMDISGCAHLWNGEREYLKHIILRLRSAYDARGAIADTIGAAWANARYGRHSPIIEPGDQKIALLPLPPEALRLDAVTCEKLYRLGIKSVAAFIDIEPSALVRRFGKQIHQRIWQALGIIEEPFKPLKEPVPYLERLPSLEPIKTRHGIEIAIDKLLEALCCRLKREDKGIRSLVLSCYRTDNQIVQVNIGTSECTCNKAHLFHLFELRISGIKPKEGIELFTLQALSVEPLKQQQEKLWTSAQQTSDKALAEFLDVVAAKVGPQAIRRYLPEKHHWPERSIKTAAELTEKPTISWPRRLLRPVQLLPDPKPIQVTAPIPDYPPMVFIYKGEVHEVKKAHGPERIEREWWIDDGLHRDYYVLEDAKGRRYWVFRLGHFDPQYNNKWFVHGFFA